MSEIFEAMYQAAASGGDPLPWDRGRPHPLIEEWARSRDGRGHRALVVGSGLGSDAELLAELGFATVAFDSSPTAISMARERHPGSRVEYLEADLLDPPAEWKGAFDLVVESLTVQSMPTEMHAAAIASVAAMVAPGGTLLVVATGRDEGGPVDGPPYPLTREEVEAFGRHGLELARLEDRREPGAPLRWRAEYRRPG